MANALKQNPDEDSEEEDGDFFDLFDDEDDKKPSFLKVISKAFWRFFYIIKNALYEVKYGFQKLFSPCNCSSRDLWSLDHHLAKIIYPKIKAYKEYERHGYPNYFSEYDENAWGSKEKYEKEIADGNIAGGGPDAWEKTLDEIIFAFEYFLFGRDPFPENGPKANNFFKKYGYKNPFAKIPENKNIDYTYKMTPDYLAKENEKSMAKKFGGLSPYVLSGEPDLHIKEPENYILIKSREHYYDCKYHMEIEKRGMKGFELFGKFFTSLWD